MSHTETFNKIMQSSKHAKKVKVLPLPIEPRENMTALQEDLSKCTYSGNTVFLPRIGEVKLHNYNQVRTALMNAGAEYKKNTFVFPNDAKPYIDRLMGGESVNIRKEFQFFPTPDGLADRLVQLAEIKKGDRILEPSAGQGAIIKAIRRAGASGLIDFCELNPINVEVLNGYEELFYIANDFLALPDGMCRQHYHRIIANPPFSKNQDIDHIYAMYECLKIGGRIVTIASNHWKGSGNKKEKSFRDFLDNVNAEVIEIPRGEFKSSGTMVGSVIIVINK